MAHAYKIGAMVDFTPARSSMPASTQKYEVIRLLPPESGENQYRIKCKTETFERIARESELKRRS
jgi:hypothetical protein